MHVNTRYINSTRGKFVDSAQALWASFCFRFVTKVCSFCHTGENSYFCVDKCGDHSATRESIRVTLLTKCVDHSAILQSLKCVLTCWKSVLITQRHWAPCLRLTLFTKCKDLPATLESIDFTLFTKCVDLSATLVSLDFNLLTKCVDLSATLESINVYSVDKLC